MIDAGQDGARFDEQRRSRVGQLDAARPAPEQLHVELALQRADLLAERGLLHPEALGRPRHMPLLRHGDKIAKMPKLHLPYPFDMNIAIAILWLDGRAKATVADIWSERGFADAPRLRPGPRGR